MYEHKNLNLGYSGSKVLRILSYNSSPSAYFAKIKITVGFILLLFQSCVKEQTNHMIKMSHLKFQLWYIFSTETSLSPSRAHGKQQGAVKDETGELKPR